MTSSMRFRATGTAAAALGLACCSYNGGGTTFVVNGTIANTTANEDDGGIRNFINTAVVYNCTMTANDADHDQSDVGGLGGGANIDNPYARFANGLD